MYEGIQESQLHKIVHLIQINRLEDALKLAQEYIQTHPQDSEGYGVLAKIYLRQDKYKESLHWGKEALKIDPHSFLGWQVTVATYFDSQDWKKFDEMVMQAMEVFPEEGYYYFLKGSLFNKHGKFTKALEYFEKAARLEPDNALFIANCSYNYALLNDREKSVEYEKQSLRLEVENDMVFLYLGWAAQERGDFDKAIEYMGNAVKLDPQDKQIRQEYLAVLQTKYKFYRIFLFPSRMKRWQIITLWIIGWIVFKPLIILFLLLYWISHWVTKLIVHVKIFGWTFRRA